MLAFTHIIFLKSKKRLRAFRNGAWKRLSENVKKNLRDRATDCPDHRADSTAYHLAGKPQQKIANLPACFNSDIKAYADTKENIVKDRCAVVIVIVVVRPVFGILVQIFYQHKPFFCRRVTQNKMQKLH